jgi:hypothetical protein
MSSPEAPDPAVVAGWRGAEDSLYGPLLADPPAYEQVVALVGTLVDHLRASVDDVPGLVEASRRGVELVGEVAPEAALPWLPLEAVLRAACAMRYRELLVAREREDRRNRLAAAAADGATWVRIVDAASGAVAVVAPALVVHVASGMAVRCTTEMDPDTGGARFVSRPVVVDRTTGDVIGPLSGVGADRASPTVAGRDADVHQLQKLIERLDSEGRVG